MSYTYAQREQSMIDKIAYILNDNEKKRKQFDKFMDRIFAYTSDYGFDVKETEWFDENRDSYFIYELKGCRASLRLVVDYNVGWEEPIKIVRKSPKWKKGYYEDNLSGLSGEDVFKLLKEQ